jgi:hypothetical protein
MVDHGAGCQLALLEQVGWVGSKVVGSELVGGLAEVLGEVRNNPQIVMGWSAASDEPAAGV